MKVISDIDVLRQQIQMEKQKATQQLRPCIVGFVPTMGFLHEGHASLMDQAKQDSDIVVLSIFVNPLQFGPNEDFEQYPRDHERDIAIAKQHGVDIVFIPDTQMMYPQPSKTKVSVAEITEILSGQSRPGHFEGVTTVVTKLFNIVQPDKAYFGLKDAQQVAVIQQMVKDLNIPVHIVPCPIVRDQDGLAMSSRNVYLSPEERQQALKLSEALRQVDHWIDEDDTLTVEGLKQKISKWIQQAPLAAIDYVEILPYPALTPYSPELLVSNFPEDTIIDLAVRFGKTRLIDNKLIIK